MNSKRWRLGALFAVCLSLFPLTAIAEDEDPSEADPNEQLRHSEDESEWDAEDRNLDNEAISSATGGAVSVDELEASSSPTEDEEVAEPDE